MRVNNTIINADLEEIITVLQRELGEKQIPYLQKTINGPKDIQVQCPYHGDGQERRPSAGIRKQDGVFHCFACGVARDLTEVISYCFGYKDFGRYGHKWLINHFNSIGVEEGRHVEITVGRGNTSNKNTVLDDSSNNKLNFVTEEELDKYRYYHKYWTSRGITDEWTIELFDLGYDKDTACITFPVRDINGNCLFVARRSINTKWFNYPQKAEKPLYGLYELQKQPEQINKIYITESMIDCLLLWQAGKYALALNGTGSDTQISEIKRLGVRHIVLATDNDKAGNKARQRLKKGIKNKIITEVLFPDDIKDIGDLGKAGRFYEIKNIERWEVL